MREIKFRIWQGKRFHYWGFIKSKFGDDYEFHAIADTNVEPLTMTEKKERSQQYINLKDKNGVEIYEGDILEAQHWNYPVSWDETNAQWRADRGHTYLPTSTWGHHQVIGNIYENPELVNAHH